MDLDHLPFLDLGNGDLEESDDEEDGDLEESDDEEDGDMCRFLDRRSTSLSRSLIRSSNSSGESKWDGAEATDRDLRYGGLTHLADSQLRTKINYTHLALQEKKEWCSELRKRINTALALHTP